MIRLATENDAPAVAAILREAFEEYRALYTDAGFAATTPTSQGVLDRISEGPMWVAVHDGVPEGTAAAVIKGDSLYIRGMAVLPAARGQKLGERFLQHIEDYAVGNNCRRLSLSTTPFLDRAIRLYHHWGFTRIAEGPSDLFGTSLLTMEKVLKDARDQL